MYLINILRLTCAQKCLNVVALIKTADKQTRQRRKLTNIQRNIETCRPFERIMPQERGNDREEVGWQIRRQIIGHSTATLMQLACIKEANNKLQKHFLLLLFVWQHSSAIQQPPIELDKLQEITNSKRQRRDKSRAASLHLQANVGGEVVGACVRVEVCLAVGVLLQV